jgi:hypothetical protein
LISVVITTLASAYFLNQNKNAGCIDNAMIVKRVQDVPADECGKKGYILEPDIVSAAKQSPQQAINTSISNSSKQYSTSGKPCSYKTIDGRTGSYYPNDYKWQLLPDGTTADIESPDKPCDKATLEIVKKEAEQKELDLKLQLQKSN